MKHLSLFFLCIFAFCLAGITSVPRPAAAGDLFSIEGTVTFYKVADITLLLLTKAELENMTQNSYKLILKPDSATEGTGELPFIMTDVPEGTYVLLAYQDLNNSKAIDSRFFSFSEPWGTFRPQRPGMGFGLNFDDLKFNLSKNLHNISILLTR